VPNSYFQFKKFRIEQDRCAMKVTTDACILGSWVPIPNQGNFLDIGTGTGLLCLMLAQRSKGEIDAVELDQESFDQAKENVERSSWSKRISIIHSDIRNFQPGKKYDFIICNPPFFQEQLKSSMSKKNIARHDETLNVSTLLQSVERLLIRPDGKLAVLFPFNQLDGFISAAGKSGLFLYQKLLICDHWQKEVTRCVMVFGCLPSSEIKTETLLIKDDLGNYTSQFIELLKDFYLHL
jgi:tRNA1Val (adenine37-N6)-methyltransferase